MTDSPLDRLAERLGINTRYVDGTGVARRTSVDGTLALIRARGVPIERVDQAHAALASWEKQRANSVSAPVLIAWDGFGPIARVRATPQRGPLDCRLTLADGTEVEWTVDASPDQRLGGGDHRWRRIAVPGDLPFGRHELEVSTPRGGVVSMPVVSAPSSAPTGPIDQGGRGWGVFLPLYAAWHHPARGRPGAPIGDLGDLRRLARWAADRGASVVATLPLLAAFTDEPAEASPYAPVSRLAWNELFIDLEDLPGELVTETVASRRRALRRFSAQQDSRWVDHAQVASAKRTVLRAIVDALMEQPGLRVEFERFVDRHPEIDDYAQFRSVGVLNGRDWRSWPIRWRDGRLGGADADPTEVRVHQVSQWLMARQMQAIATEFRSLGVGLGLDVPLGAHPSGFDCWRYREVFAEGVTVGAPPDEFFPAGQNWGFPPIRPDAGLIDGWSYVARSLDHQMAVANHLRIDHIMGLSRQFWIPHGGASTDGAYVSYPADELVALLTLAAHQHHTAVIGEDLGTVSPDVRSLMSRHRLRGMYVAQFEMTEDPHVPIRAPRTGQVASWGTHDLPPFAAWVSGSDIDERRDLDLLTDEEAIAARQNRDAARGALDRLVDQVDGTSSLPAVVSGDASPRHGRFAAMVEFLGRSDADLVMVDVEDLLGETVAQNVPGTHRERTNWSRRARVAVDDLASERDVSEVLSRLDRARRAPRVADLAAESWLSPDDLHLFNEGTHQRLADVLGAHPRVVDGVSGVQFAVWAPDAERVAVIGSFNEWNGGSNPLSPVARSGIWQGFVAGVSPGQLYKFLLTPRFGGADLEKADPFAFRAELPPRTASVVWQSSHEWADDDWMTTRHAHQGPGRAMSIYEVHLASWRRVPDEGDRWLTYRELAPLLADYCVEMGFSHVELMPVMEHPYGPSWGYQITGYFAPTSRHGDPDDFAWFVDHLHQRGIGVILDWVPSHFPSDAHGLAAFDGSYLYEHADPRRRIQPDWQSLIFNYGRREVQSFLLSNAAYWLERFHVDGLRFDAVASMLYLDYSRGEGDWVPNVDGGNEHLEAVSFLRRLNTALYGRFPDVMLMAEESTSWPGVSAPVHAGGLGFGYKWDLGWMHDTLRYLHRDPAHRRWHHHELTFRSLYSGSEHFVLPLSHDEVVHGKGSLLSKMPGDDWQRCANLRLLFGYQFTIPGTPLLFMGSELAGWEEWSHDHSLPWHLLERDAHRGVQQWVRHLNHVLRSEPSLYAFDRAPEGFEWVDADDANQSVYAWIRRGPDDAMAVIVLNATPVPRPARQLQLPGVRDWQLVANSDEQRFGGSGIPVQWRVSTSGPAGSIELDLPPLGVVVLVAR